MERTITTPDSPVAVDPDDAEWLRERLGDRLAARRAALELSRHPRDPDAHPGRRSLSSRAVRLIPEVLRLTGMLAWGRRNAARVRLVRRDVVVLGLPPAFDGFRVLHLTDLHADISREAVIALGVALDGVGFDACVVTGDFRGRTHGPHGPAVGLVRVLVSFLRGPVFGVLGNHDPGAIAPDLERLGMRMLMNEAVPVERSGARLWIAGVDDPHHYRTDDLGAALSSVSFGETVVLLSHSADNAGAAADLGVGLFLCGHTHGGQICLPGGLPLVIGLRMPWLRAVRFAAGAWRLRGMAGYTCRGVGTSVVAARFNCPPEAVVHTLRSRPSRYVASGSRGISHGMR